NMTHYKLLITLLLAVSLAACSKDRTVPDPEPDPDYVAGQGSDGASSTGWDNNGLGQGEEFGNNALDGELAMIIYFDFDESELRAEYADLLARHATRLANNSRVNVRLEGHADERGSREYNIGLAERRAQAVRRMLLIQGAGAGQIATVSFGEERPAAFGSDEDSYQLNRRVEIKYLN
ncbi:MAG: peptidoglycan-associated lipoprotein Pal, partial [Woeseia sp.]|nr:peptidoglycan-associated lipoprotein Pal [Woeseia sp.]